MADNFFIAARKRRLARLWINNPTDSEIEMALEYWAVSYTTNQTNTSYHNRRTTIEACRSQEGLG